VQITEITKRDLREMLENVAWWDVSKKQSSSGRLYNQSTNFRHLMGVTRPPSKTFGSTELTTPIGLAVSTDVLGSPQFSTGFLEK
jgi:hypothetical protein